MDQVLREPCSTVLLILCLAVYQVWYLLFCETLNTGFDIGMMYEPLIVRYGELRYLIWVIL
jgi:hypothetical protein